MKYEIRNAKGHVCCMTDRFTHLCDACQQRANATGVPRPQATASGAVPAPPDLTAAIRGKRAVSRLTPAERQDRARQIVAEQPRLMADGSRP